MKFKCVKCQFSSQNERAAGAGIKLKWQKAEFINPTWVKYSYNEPFSSQLS